MHRLVSSHCFTALALGADLNMQPAPQWNWKITVTMYWTSKWSLGLGSLNHDFADPKIMVTMSHLGHLDYALQLVTWLDPKSGCKNQLR